MAGGNHVCPIDLPPSLALRMWWNLVYLCSLLMLALWESSLCQLMPSSFLAVAGPQSQQKSLNQCCLVHGAYPAGSQLWKGLLLGESSVLVSLWDSLVLCDKEVVRTQGSPITWKDIILRLLGLMNLGDDVDEIAAKAAGHQWTRARPTIHDHLREQK